MATQIYPALGNSLNRFFTTGGSRDPEPRVYQCKYTKGDKNNYECIKQISGMLADNQTKIVEIPKYVPEVLDGMYLWGVMARASTLCCRPPN